MTSEQETMLLLRGSIASLPESERQLVDEAAAALREVLARYPDGHALMALALLGAEAAL